MEEKDKKNYWKITGIVLLVLLVWFLMGNNKDYEYCVDNCVLDNEWCVTDYTEYGKSGLWYLSEIEVEECFWDLEDCIEDCKK